MGEVVNLRRARKMRVRAAAAAAAATATEQRARYGRSRAEKHLDQAREEKHAHELDSHRREPGRAPEPAR